MTTQTVTTKTTKNRTVPIEISHAGRKRINTFDNVSPTTTLYDIIAATKRREREGEWVSEWDKAGGSGKRKGKHLNNLKRIHEC